MAAIGGKAGALTIASTGTINFSSWTVNYNQAAIDVTAFTATTRAKVAGIYEWSFTAEGTLDGGVAFVVIPTSAVACVFTAATGRTYSGNAIVTGMAPSVTIDGTATITVTGEGAAALTPA